MILREGLVFIVVCCTIAGYHCLTPLPSESLGHSVLSTPSFAEASQVLENLLIEHISRPSQQLKKRKGTHKILKPVIRRSSLTGGVVGAAKDIDSRIQTTLETIESNIPVAIESIEKDIAISNRDKVILALANFLGMVFGVLKATAGSTNWEDVSTGNKIQTSRTSANQDANTVETYIDVYTQLLNERVESL